MLSILEKSLYILGIFLGPLFGAQPADPIGALQYFEKLVVLVLAIICWVAFERSFLRYLTTTIQNTGRRSAYNSWVTTIGLILTAMISLGMLHAFKVRNQDFVFLLLVGFVSSRLLKIGSAKINSAITFYPATLFEHAILGSLSFFILTDRPDWQPLVVGLGYGFCMVALIQARSINKLLNIPLLPANFSARIFTICFSLGPILWSCLSFAGQLPKIYSAFILLIIPYRNIQKKFSEAMESHRSKPQLADSLQLDVLTLSIIMFLAAALMLLL